MSTESKKSNSIFPNYPRGEKVVNADGSWMPGWHQTLGSLFQALQRNWKSEGLLIPTLSFADITNIQTLYHTFYGSPLPQNVPNISGQMVYDTDNNVPKIFVITFTGQNVTSATWKTFTIT